MIIKICGLKRIEDLRLAMTLGADVVGMIMGVPESPRNNSPESVRAMFEASGGGDVQRALLFRSSPLEEVLSTVQEFLPEVIHLCGNEDASFRSNLKVRFPRVQVWQTVGVPVDAPEEQSWVQEVKDLFKDPSVDQVVLDSAKGGKSGGVGQSFPLEGVQSELAEDSKRIILAGGLGPDNILKRVDAIHPLGVDVSSGLEVSPGRKDPDLMKQFFKVLRREG